MKKFLSLLLALTMLLSCACALADSAWPDGTVQLIDVFDLNAFETVHFHFMTPCRPVLGEKFAQLGPVRLRWEEGLTAECETIEMKDEPWKSLWNGSLYRLTLTTAEPVDGGEYTFTLNALRTFG